MTEKEFINEIADIIEAEPDDLTFETNFRDAADYWSSLTGFAIMIFIQVTFGIIISPEIFSSKQTIGDLYALTTEDK